LAVSPLESCLGFKADLYQDKVPTLFMHSLITAHSICSPQHNTESNAAIGKQLQKQFCKP